VGIVSAFLRERGSPGYTEDQVRRMRDMGRGSDDSRCVLADAIRVVCGVRVGASGDTPDAASEAEESEMVEVGAGT
jgi:hypothetical protein